MKAVVFGAGAIGQWVGALLARSGADTVLVVRPRHLPALQSGGLRLEPQDPPLPVRFVGALADLPAGHRAPDWLLLTVKAFDVAQALQEVRQAGLQPGRVLAIQNGVGSDQAVAQAFGSERTFVGSVTRAVSLTPGGALEPARQGGLAVAPYLPGADARDLLARFAGLPTGWFDDAISLKWSKLLLNMAANATCAILDLLPPRVLGCYPLYALEIRAVREALRVMRRLRAEVLDLPDYPVRLFARVARTMPTLASYPFVGPRMARARGEKPPSLLLDLRAGRTRTEVAWLNGAVVRAGASRGVPTPVNAFLERTVSGIAAGTVPWEAFRHRPEALIEGLRRGGAGEAVEGAFP